MPRVSPGRQRTIGSRRASRWDVQSDAGDLRACNYGGFATRTLLNAFHHRLARAIRGAMAGVRGSGRRNGRRANGEYGEGKAAPAEASNKRGTCRGARRPRKTQLHCDQTNDERMLYVWISEALDSESGSDQATSPAATENPVKTDTGSSWRRPRRLTGVLHTGASQPKTREAAAAARRPIL